MAVVWAVMTSMEGSHGRRPWEVNESTKCYVLHLLLNFEGKHLQKKRKKRRRRKLREDFARLYLGNGLIIRVVLSLL